MRLVESLALCVLLLAVRAPALQQEDKANSSLSGCLSKGERAGEYVLTDEKTGQKTIVVGPTDLEKHAANHEVTLIGKLTTRGEQRIFEATAITHIANACLAPK